MSPARHRSSRPRPASHSPFRVAHPAVIRNGGLLPASVLAGLAAAALLGACGGEVPTRPLSERAASLELAVDTVDLARPGDARRLEVTVRDSAGRELPVAPTEPSWSVDDTLTARLGPDGTLAAAAPGRASVVARLGAAADTALVRVVPGARVEILLPPDSALRTWPGDTLAVAARITDAAGAVVEGGRVRWSVADTAVAGAGPPAAAARVRGRGAGRTRLVASVEHDADTARLVVATRIDGEVRALGGDVPDGAHVFLRYPGDGSGAASVDAAERGTGPRLDSAVVAADASFDLRARRPLTGDTVDVWVDQRTAGPRTHLPAAWHDVPLERGFRVDALLIPTTWTIRDGELAGREVGVSLQRIFAYPNAWDSGNYFAVWKDNWSAWRAERRAGGPVSRAPSVAWPDSAFPVPVFFRDSGSSSWLSGPARPRRPVSPEDSVVFWENVARMEERVGRDLFRPARREELPPDTVSGDALEVRYAVRVEVVDLEGRGAATAFLDSPAYPASDLIGAFVAIGSTAYFDDSTVPHELTHALGYYHACFPSSVDHCVGPYPFQHLPTVTDAVHPSQYDVAHMEMLRAAHPELLRRAPNFGLVAALNGERIHLLGLPPVSESWLGGPAPVTRRPIR